MDENRQTNLVSKGSSNTEKYPKPIFLNKRGNIHYFSPEMLEKLLEKCLYKFKYKYRIIYVWITSPSLKM